MKCRKSSRRHNIIQRKVLTSEWIGLEIFPHFQNFYYNHIILFHKIFKKIPEQDFKQNPNRDVRKNLVGAVSNYTLKESLCYLRKSSQGLASLILYHVTSSLISNPNPWDWIKIFQLYFIYWVSAVCFVQCHFLWDNNPIISLCKWDCALCIETERVCVFGHIPDTILSALHI